MLDFDADSNALRVLGVYAHAAEVWHIAPCPADAALAVTVFNEGAVGSPPVPAVALSLQAVTQCVWGVCWTAHRARTCCLCLYKCICNRDLCALLLEAKVSTVVQQRASLLCCGALPPTQQAGSKRQTQRAVQARCTEYLTRGLPPQTLAPPVH